MTTTTTPPIATREGYLPDAPAAARRVLRMLSRLRCGTLQLRLPDGSTPRFGDGSPAATMNVHDWRVFPRALRAGDIGFAEGFIAGEWDAPDVPALIALLLVNRDALERAFYGSWWGSLLFRLRHLLNRNSRRGSRRNVHAHYDLGNAFYAQWLDDSMTYSGAWFGGDRSRPLADAQQAKLRRALVEAGVSRGSRVLEIGCGWGSLAMIAARDFDARITGVTLSREQLDWARRRLADAGLSGQCAFHLRDYRDLPDVLHSAQRFDAIVSVEMFEAVGYEHWAEYFRTLARCLKPGGRACIQTITIRDELFDRYRQSTDFIQQYIFPGGLLPSGSAFEDQARRAGFAVERRLTFGLDYAETLRRWRARFLQREREITALGFDTGFVRTWQFYLAYCEAAFVTGNTNVVQFTLRAAG